MKKAKTTTRHFKLDWDCTLDELREFFRAVRRVTAKASYFRGGIGEIYLSVTGAESESDLYGVMLTSEDTAEDVLHEWRKKIRLLKTLSRKPQPEKRWRGAWIEIKPETNWQRLVRVLTRETFQINPRARRRRMLKSVLRAAQFLGRMPDEVYTVYSERYSTVTDWKTFARLIRRGQVRELMPVEIIPDYGTRRTAQTKRAAAR